MGGFLYALNAMDALKRGRRTILDPELARLHPYAMASVAGYMTGMFSLTLTYLVPTYTMLGIAVVFLRLTPTGAGAGGALRPPLPGKPAGADVAASAKPGGVRALDAGMRQVEDFD